MNPTKRKACALLDSEGMRGWCFDNCAWYIGGPGKECCALVHVARQLERIARRLTPKEERPITRETG